MPRRPSVPEPQHHALPSSRTAHVCASPGATSRHGPSSIFVGTRLSIPVPSPTWPLKFRPQHHKLPSLWIPHVVRKLVAITRHVSPPMRVGSPVSSTPSPRPACPSRLRPQHQSELSMRSPHVCLSPPVTSCHVPSIAAASTGALSTARRPNSTSHPPSSNAARAHRIVDDCLTARASAPIRRSRRRYLADRT